jgi:hypothetical protein
VAATHHEASAISIAPAAARTAGAASRRLVAASLVVPPVLTAVTLPAR